MEGQGVRIPDEAVHARELGRSRSETDEEHAARADARHVDRAREAERNAGVEVEAVQLGDETQVVADRASRTAGRERIRQPASGPLGVVGNGEPVGGERARRRGVEIEPRLDRRRHLCRAAPAGSAPSSAAITTAPRIPMRPQRAADRPHGRPPRIHGRVVTAPLGRSAGPPSCRSGAPGHLDRGEVAVAIGAAHEDRAIVAAERVRGHLADVGRR